MRPLTGRERVLLLVAFVIIYAVGFVFLIYQPYTERVSALGTTLKRKQDDLGAAMAIFHRLEEINARIDELSREMSGLDLLVPGDNRAAHFLYACGQWERTTGARVTEMVFNSPVATGDFEEYKVNFSVLGSYTAQVSFLANLESMNRLVRVDSVTLEPAEATTPTEPGEGEETGETPTGSAHATTDVVTARYSVHLFVDPSKAAIAAEEEPGAGLTFTLSEGRRTPFLP